MNVTFYAYEPTGARMPLSQIEIDWGDGTQSRSGGYNIGGSLQNRKAICESEFQSDGITPNPNYNFGNKPGACIQNTVNGPGYFSFNHTYTCVPNGLGWVSNGCGSEDCCVFKPRVRVVDNWGYCSTSDSTTYIMSGIFLIGGDVPVPSHQECTNNPGSWIYAKGDVQILP